jgi:hypothetical protein
MLMQAAASSSTLTCTILGCDSDDEMAASITALQHDKHRAAVDASKHNHTHTSVGQ